MSIDPLLLDSMRTARHICILTGAGVSAESGVPTFRDALTGLWARFDPADLATPEAFERDPKLVTQWYDERRCNVAACRPNAGHVTLARLEALLAAQNKRCTLITQNVDRLHQLAGNTNVIELHGTLWMWRCVDCDAATEERGAAFTEFPPRCACGGAKRPGVVWFGENLPEAALFGARSAVEDCDLFMSLGTSSVVHPAAGLIDLALHEGARVLEINPQATPYTPRVHWSLPGKTGELLPQLVAEAFGASN